MQRNPLPNNALLNPMETHTPRPTTNTTLTPSVPVLTPAQMYSNFEEWIKMCTDNKVNASNTWNVALIDYFHEMTFIKEGDSINFQRASCTLDGCVKIYSSRVDSVAAETGKLLSGLADSTNGIEGEDESRQTGERRTRRKTNRSEATLLKEFSSIAVKKFDLDFAVDPLFKKTSADFDEGGARGLLLNHLGVDQHCRLVFDASDATVECDKEELDGEEESSQNSDNAMEEAEEQEVQEKLSQNADDNMEEDSMDIDEPIKETSPIPQDALEEEIISNTETESIVEMSRLKAKLPTWDVLKELGILPSLKGFDFFSENDLEIPDLDLDDEEEENNMPMEDPFQFDEFDGADYDADDIDPFGFDDNDNQADDDMDTPELDNSEKDNPEPDFLTAMLNNGERELFNYFDTTLVQNWAGPEHWKLRRPPPTVTDNTEKPKKKAKIAFQIPFNEEDNDEDENVIFETSTRKLTFSKDAMSKMTKQLLPDDIHFTSKQLLQYFLKPMFPSNPKKKTNPVESAEAPLEEESDATFWAEQTENFMDGVDYGDDDIQVDFGSTIDQTTSIFNDTPSYHDDYDDPEVSVLYGDALITNHNLKKSKPLYVNYAKAAKRVDVKKLKDNLWRSLTLESEHKEGEKENVQGPQKFTDVVHNLKRMYSPKTMRDISVPFCFICLLHLANEKDLSIEGLKSIEQDDDDFVLGEGDWMNDESLLNEVTITQNTH
ncbi:hypothetical protein INT48_001656 [Thamnidium elegans]|uniref:Condensin complex subunit 2 n=1 Tax=Thamnidium elegans TaxID=101142 RepID=A0A8H7SRL1_9FUNG|nr:hypothetical protein INT48_001656 [Thamnidium elegans]